MTSASDFYLKLSVFVFFAYVNLSLINAQIQCPIQTTFCTDHTICSRGFCAPPGNYSEEKPYLVKSECGCCEFWSECPKVGPCGTCGTDVVCTEAYPICGPDDIVSLDYCGCCRVCYEALDEGRECKTTGPNFSLCKAGLQCINGKCTRKYSAYNYYQ